MKTRALLLMLLMAGANPATASAPTWEPGRLSMRFLDPPKIMRTEGGLELGPTFRDILAGLPEARLEPLYPRLVLPTVPDLSLNYLLLVDDRRDIPALAAAFEATGQVEYAEPDFRLPLRRTPDDPLLGTQWPMTTVEALAAWDWVTDESAPVVVALIDTGLRWAHPDLRERIWINSGEDLDGDGAYSDDALPGDPDDRNGLDDDGNGFIDDFHGWDWVMATDCAPQEDCGNPDNNPNDLNGHGTACAGVAAAHTDNGIGLASLAWDARVMALRAGYTSNDGNGTVLQSAAANAIAYAMENGARIISMSFGGSSTLRTSATAAWNAGLLCFHAVGGSVDQLDNALGIVRVAATDSLDCAAPCADWIDLLAPGVDLPTLGMVGYQSSSGTSLACPQAAGLAALVWRQNPLLDNVGLRERLLATADPVGDLPCNQGCVFDVGRINARRALENDTGLPPPSRPERARLRTHPNPFNPASQVDFTLPAAGQARLAAYNLSGQRVALLLEGRLAAGEHVARFNGAELPSGLYLLRLELDGRLADQGKALLLK